MNTPAVAKSFSASQSVGQAEFEPHGGDIDTVSKRYPNAPRPWIDLSTGINPFAYPIPPLPADVWSRLPLREEDAELRCKAAHRHGAVDLDHVVSAPGTQSLIQVIPRLKEPTDVAIIGPTYREHIRCWARMGHAVRVIGELDEIDNANVVVIVNPNNPTGRHYEPRQLLSVAEDMARRQGLLLVDEAFADFLGADQSLGPLQPPSTIILRSFGKTYGLAGLRLGFAIAEPGVASVLRSWIGPWAVSGPAIAIGCRALEDTGWLISARDRLANCARRLDGLLAVAKCNIVGATPLFRLAEHPRAESVAHTLAHAGIHVRQFPDQRTWLRFGIPSDAALQRLEAALSTLPDAT
ncbi:threonine-phosphate decarboxylase CobD [Hyphomicrobium denitrificans]|nr:threonine-phosphate decarboxylase CobD [Hyphomicrobium denitrificans]